MNNDLLKGLKPFDHAAGRVLFKVYARKCVKDRYSNHNSLKASESLLENHLIPIYGERRMMDIKPSTVSAGRAEIRNKQRKNGKPGQKLSAMTISRIDALFTMIMTSAVRVDKVIVENPCADAVRIPKPVKRKIKIWEHDTVDTILDGIPVRYYPIPLLSATCGHRPAESFAVALDDIDFRRRRIGINHQVQRIYGQLMLVPPKGGKTRTVPLPDVTRRALSAHVDRYGTTVIKCSCCDEAHRVLFTDQGSLLARRGWDRDIWHPAVAGAGLTPSRRTGQHQFRHVYASELIEGGASLEQVRDYMGHASITITVDVYGHLFERSHDRARKVIDTAFGGRVYPARTDEDPQGA
ncbi:site-specific integrase [Kibdelosporangium aridum]|uniref:tyrosine-type recombinase/integrase n=1 Tax=Kibdelosporangium aridum TaxID=2030 RepID=UPI00055BC37F|nr:site-specific integrase [Kibdelosporangium aridum]